MKTLQEHYNSIKNGKGNKAQFLKQARHLFPQYINQYSDFDTATHVLKSKQIISEAAVGGVVSKGFDIWDWKKILAEEAKAEEKKVTKEVEDYNKSNFDNKDMKNADNINFNEIMKGFYAELRDEKNNGKTGDEIKAMVVKNLAKDPLYYTKNGEFGVKDLGYTDKAPGLGQPKEPKGKYKSSGYGDLDTDKEIEKVKANVQDSLGDREAKTAMPRKVKEMGVAPQNSKGVKKMPMPGVEKKIKLKENQEFSQSGMHGEEYFKDSVISYLENKYPDLISSENWDELKKKIEQDFPSLSPELVTQYWSSPDFPHGIEDEIAEKKIKLQENIQNRADAINSFAKLVKTGSDDKIANTFEANRDFPEESDITTSEMVKILKKYEKYDSIMKLVDQDSTDPAGGSGLSSHLEEQKLRSLIAKIIKEELEEAMYQGPSVKISNTGGGGEQKAPRVLYLSKEMVQAINTFEPGSIKLLSKGKDVYMYVSTFLKNALGELERGRTSHEKESKKSELARYLSYKFPSAVRGKIKKEINPKLDPGLNMHYVNIILSPNKDGDGYWIHLKKGFDPLVSEKTN